MKDKDEKSLTRIARSNIKGVIIIIFSFFLSFLLFILSGVFVLHNTVLNSDYLRQKLSESHYYENVTTEVEDEFTSYGSASGFDENFFRNIIDISDVQLHVNQSVDILYGKDNKAIDSTEFEQKLDQKLNDNVKSRSISVTPEIEKGLKLLTETCTKTYVQYISLPYSETLSPMVSKIRKPIITLEIFLGFLILFFSGLIFALSHWKHRAIRAYIYSLSGTILMISVFSLMFFVSGKVNNIALVSKSIYELSVSYLNGAVILLLQFALIYAVLLIVLILIYRYMLKNVE